MSTRAMHLKTQARVLACLQVVSHNAQLPKNKPSPKAWSGLKRIVPIISRRLRQIGSSPLGFTTIPSCAEISPRLSKSRFARKTFFEFRVGEWNGLVRVGVRVREWMRFSWSYELELESGMYFFINVVSIRLISDAKTSTSSIDSM